MIKRPVRAGDDRELKADQESQHGAHERGIVRSLGLRGQKDQNSAKVRKIDCENKIEQNTPVAVEEGLYRNTHVQCTD